VILPDCIFARTRRKNAKETRGTAESNASGWIIYVTVETVRELRPRGGSRPYRRLICTSILRRRVTRYFQIRFPESSEGAGGAGRGDGEGKGLDVSLADVERYERCFEFDVNYVFKIPPAHCKRERSG